MGEGEMRSGDDGCEIERGSDRFFVRTDMNAT